MLRQIEIASLNVGDYVLTPNGVGVFKGRVRRGREVTRVIVHHHIRNVDLAMAELMERVDEQEVVASYPVNLVDYP